jgi:uncharacterized Zn finger protein
MAELASHREFGRGRWGARWLEALADLPGAVPAQLIRGRALVRANRVGDLRIEPGVVNARIQDERPLAYPAAVTLPVLDDATWNRLTDMLATQAAHLASLLAAEAPVIDLAPLMPGPGQLRTVCTCEDRDRQPCRHTAALCYRTATAFDEDPFGLLLLRGRTKPQVLTALRDRRGAVSFDPATPGRLARDAYRTSPGPLPSATPPHRPTGSGPLTPSLAHPPTASGLTESELAELAAHAARRARELLGDDFHDSPPP